MRRLVLALALSTVIVSPAFATAYIAGAMGEYNMLRSDHTSFLFGGEYRFDPIGYGARPMLGVFANSDGGLYGYAGFHWDVPLLTGSPY